MKKICVLTLILSLGVSLAGYSQVKKLKLKNTEEYLAKNGRWVTKKIIGIPYYGDTSKVSFFKGYIVKYLPGEKEVDDSMAVIPDDYFLDKDKKRVKVTLIDYIEVEWKD